MLKVTVMLKVTLIKVIRSPTTTTLFKLVEPREILSHGQNPFKWAAILTYTFLKYTLSLCTKVYLILGVCTKVYLKNLATLDADTKVYLE